MLKISDFANLFNVSIKTVRFYEEKKLLKPAIVDIYTGYRYYDEDNIKKMNEILYLKDLGFSLEEIKNFNQEKINEKIKYYRNEIEKLSKKMTLLADFSSHNKVKYFLYKTL